MKRLAVTALLYIILGCNAGRGADARTALIASDQTPGSPPGSSAALQRQGLPLHQQETTTLARPRDSWELQRLALQTTRPLAFACYESFLWAAIDDRSAGERLDSALALNTTRCRGNVSVARLLRLVRIGQLDLPAELAHADPLARAVAVRYAALIRDENSRGRIQRLLHDPMWIVVREAIDATAALRDLQSIPTLTALAAGGAEPAATHACSALIAMGKPGNCASQVPIAVPPEHRSVLVSDDEVCATYTQLLAVRANSDAVEYLMRNRFFEVAQPFRRFLHSGFVKPCAIDEPTRRILLSDRVESQVRALTAAMMLWENYPRRMLGPH